MIISVSGYGATGASAVFGLIKECVDVQSFDYGTEFQLVQQPDGIIDLYHYIVEDRRRLSINTAISRFICDIDSNRGRGLLKQTNGELRRLSIDYVNKLIGISFNGRSNYEAADQRQFLDVPAFRKFNNLLKKCVTPFNSTFVWPPDKKRYYSSMEKDEFTVVTKKYLAEVFKAGGIDTNKNVLLEQLFPPNNPTLGMFLFEDPFCLIVERDPRDLFVLTNYLMPHYSRFMPHSGDVDDFILYYQGLHSTKTNDKRVKYVQFEDLIYEYERTSKDLLDTLALKSERPKTLFFPEHSINNTCIYKNYPELHRKIDRIEKKLESYLYPFEYYDNIGTITRDINKAFISTPGDTKFKKFEGV